MTRSPIPAGVTAKATSDSDSGTVTASIEGAKEGLIVGFTHADARTTATATATGIDGGAGNDAITHASTGVLEVTSNAMATNVVVGATVAGSVSQEWSLSASGAITKGTTETTAHAYGIEGGDGNDTITNAGKTTVHATADSDGGSISANVSGVEDGLAVGFTYADHSTKATATAGGLTGGAGDDTIRHTGTETLSVTADALASSTKVGVTVTGATKGTGIVGGAAITDGTTTATSNAAGIAGGDGNDRIVSSGPVTVASNSTATSASVSVNLGAAGGELGLVGGFSYASASTTAESTAVGIDGGAGDDRIRNTGSLTVTSTPTATSGVVGVTAQGVKGMGAAVGIGVTDGSTKATGTATGIYGGDGDDLIVNTNTITVKSLPDANSTKVTVTISAAKEGVAAGGALAIGTTTSEAHATGIDGGSGSDRIVNRGTIDTTADAQASSAHVGVSAEGTMTGVAAGVALSDGTTKAISDATGIRGGDGDDILRNTDKITATSTSDIAGASVSVHLGGAETGLVAGLAAADLSVTASSAAVGIDGGSGNDRIVNQGTVTATALSDIASASVSVIAGVAVSGVAAGGGACQGGHDGHVGRRGAQGRRRRGSPRQLRHPDRRRHVGRQGGQRGREPRGHAGGPCRRRFGRRRPEHGQARLPSGSTAARETTCSATRARPRLRPRRTARAPTSPSPAPCRSTGWPSGPPSRRRPTRPSPMRGEWTAGREATGSSTRAPSRRTRRRRRRPTPFR